MQKKSNLLGLTPTKVDPDSEPEDDEGEEARLAGQNKVSSGLEIEYGGNNIILRTAAEIAAFIAERKKRYPTQAKVDAAKKEAEEKKRRERRALLTSQSPVTASCALLPAPAPP
jgi:hypothetical protein